MRPAETREKGQMVVAEQMDLVTRVCGLSWSGWERPTVARMVL